MPAPALLCTDGRAASTTSVATYGANRAMAPERRYHGAVMSTA
jgi:hypothetical protein